MIRDVPWHVLAGRDVLAAWMRELSVPVASTIRSASESEG